MLRSKSISDYFEISLSDIRRDQMLTFDVYLYFSRNNHILQWMKTGNTPTEAFLKHYTDRGLKKLWVYGEDRDEFERYRNPPKQSIDPASYISAINSSPNLDREQKLQFIAEGAKSVLYESLQATTQEQQKEASQKALKAVKEIMPSDLSASSQPEVNNEMIDLWNMCLADPDLEHASSVATSAVLFAMALELTDGEFLSDVALAGLLHDVGLSQIPFTLASMPWQKMTEEMKREYSEHVRLGVRLVQNHIPNVPSRVLAAIQSHHEAANAASDQTVQEIMQLVATADLLHSVSTGQYDGKMRTLPETLETAETLIQSESLPPKYAPAKSQTFEQVCRCLRSTPEDLTKCLNQATQVVKSEAEKLTGTPNAA